MPENHRHEGARFNPCGQQDAHQIKLKRGPPCPISRGMLASSARTVRVTALFSLRDGSKAPHDPRANPCERTSRVKLFQIPAVAANPFDRLPPVNAGLASVATRGLFEFKNRRHQRPAEVLPCVRNCSGVPAWRSGRFTSISKFTWSLPFSVTDVPVHSR